MPRKSNYTVCPCCGKERILTRHHVYPRRVFGRQNNNELFLLCRACHDELETFIPYHPMPADFYPRILNEFVTKLCKVAKEKEP